MLAQPLARPDWQASAGRRPARAGGFHAGHGAFLLAHNGANLLNYAYLLAMSRALAPDDFALFASLFGAVYLASALANTAQWSVAAAVAVDPAATDASVASAVRRLTKLSLPFGLVVLVAARPIASVLHSDDVLSVALSGAAIALSLFAATGYGGLQGSDRFGLLGTGLVVAASGRLVLSAGFLLLGLGVRGALLGLVIGLALSAALVLAPYARSVARAPSHGSAGPPLVAALLASIAIATPTSADVVFARHYFAPDQAAAYAAVSVLGKVAVFGPMAVSLIFLPRFMSDATQARRSLRLGLLLNAVIAVPLAAAVTAIALLAPDLILRRYDVPPEVLLAYLGAMLAFSFVVMLLYYFIARRATLFIYSTPLVLAGELAVAACWHPSLLAVVSLLLAGNMLLLAAGLLLARALAPVESSPTGRSQPIAIGGALQDGDAQGLAERLGSERAV